MTMAYRVKDSTWLVQLAGEGRQMDARLNALLARPASEPLAAPRGLRFFTQSGTTPATLQELLRASNRQLFANDSRIRAAEKYRDLTFKIRYPDFIAIFEIKID